ncbi:hypothetical protein [Stigmatella aurantiaca]|uniref:Uncharacterized protein n=1 Tax=Stigmatella aurantiaca (strain DW4/3-1) TaxID=378806 RepID=Q094I9_STIAD|nr:hypothetical protein [Stigmatella aurantiaca]ADO68622.1 uncharacterized protein STAUR_0818 [Stigmatella aurantiaca DW4/3-1]EAU67172.1 hypothetical protein STIAU_0523 [Stigmatella aurantiaca DW4/3-1]
MSGNRGFVAYRLLGMLLVLTGYASALAPGHSLDVEEEPPPSRLYANATSLEENVHVINAESALGAPDLNSATVLGVLGASLLLDMGEGEEGTGDLRVYYSGVSIGLVTQVEFLRADGTVITKSLLQLAKIRGGNEVTVVKYKGLTTPYRYVRLKGGLAAAYQVDAVMAVDVVDPLPIPDTEPAPEPIPEPEPQPLPMSLPRFKS